MQNNEKFKGNLRAQEYWIYETLVPCFACKKQSRATAILFLKQFEVRGMDCDTWKRKRLSVMLQHVEHVGHPLDYQLTFINPFYYPDSDSLWHEDVYLNHCEHCGQKFEEDYLLGGNSFMFPMGQADPGNGLLRHVIGPVECRASYMTTDEFSSETRIVRIKPSL